MENPIRRAAKSLQYGKQWNLAPKLLREPVATIRSRNTRFAKTLVLATVMPAQLLGAGWLPHYMLNMAISRQDRFGDPLVSNAFTNKAPALRTRPLPIDFDARQTTIFSPRDYLPATSVQNAVVDPNTGVQPPLGPDASLKDLQDKMISDGYRNPKTDSEYPEELKLQGYRDLVKKTFLPSNTFIQQSLHDSRLKNGHIRHFAETINTNGNDDLLNIAYLSHCASQVKGSDATHTKLMQQAYGEEIEAQYNDAPQLLARYAKLDPYQMAVLEEKSRLMVGRAKAIFNTDMSNRRFDNLITGMHALFNFEASVLGEQNGQNTAADYKDKAVLDFQVSQFANRNILKTGTEQELMDDIANKLAKKYRDFESNGSLTTAQKEEAKERIRSLVSLHSDVLTLIEKERNDRKRAGNKVEAERALREILSDGTALVFRIGQAFLMRTGVDGNNFVVIGGTKEDWGQAAMMSMKYLQDRGDPWRGRVKITGQNEATNYVRAIFRQNSIRMAETGHSEPFLVNEIKMDVIGNYLFNHDRGYIVVRTVKCDLDENGKEKIVYRKDPTNTYSDGIMRVKITQYLKKNGEYTLNQHDPDISIVERDGKQAYEHVKEDAVRVPETTSTLVWSGKRCDASDTPTPETYVKNFNVDDYNMDWMAPSSACVYNPYASMQGAASGDYLYCGSLTPERKSGQNDVDFTDDLYSQARLFNMKNDPSFALLCEAAKQYDMGKNASSNDPRQNLANMLGEIISEMPSEDQSAARESQSPYNQVMQQGPKQDRFTGYGSGNEAKTASGRRGEISPGMS